MTQSPDYLRIVAHILLSSKHSGSLPESIGDGWSKMVWFDIQKNAFTGSLPPSLGNWTDLVWLDVQSNQLSGSLSDSFGAWSQLSIFNLNGNRFTGSLPDWGKLKLFQVRWCVDGYWSTLENCSHTSFSCIILHRLIVTLSQGLFQARWPNGLSYVRV